MHFISLKVALAVMASCLVLSTLSCLHKDTYRPIYYPSKYDLTIYTRGPAMDNLAQARQWVEDQSRQRRDRDWTYEIGKNCKPLSAQSDIEVCEETLK